MLFKTNNFKKGEMFKTAGRRKKRRTEKEEREEKEAEGGHELRGEWTARIKRRKGRRHGVGG